MNEPLLFFEKDNQLMNLQLRVSVITAELIRSRIAYRRVTLSFLQVKRILSDAEDASLNKL
jgi:hypothetical protein